MTDLRDKIYKLNRALQFNDFHLNESKREKQQLIKSNIADA